MSDPKPNSDNLPTLYVCPGEIHPISKAIHYARLAAFYPKCRTCPFRRQTGNLSNDLTESNEEAHSLHHSLVTPVGLRGVYLNDINRFHAASLANGYVTLLHQMTLQDRFADDSTIVVGYQEHTAAPDLMIGVVNALRATGVPILDVGLTTGPELSFAIRQQRALGGIMVSGSGSDPAWIGLDFLMADGRPILDRSRLSQIEAARTSPTFRLPQAVGGYRTWDVLAEYRSSLSGLFHAMRPLRIGLGSSLKRLNEFATELFESLPCTFELFPLPHRRRQLDEADDSDVQKMGAFVRDRGLHLGVVCDDDGRRIALINDEGVLVPADQWQTWLFEGESASRIFQQVFSDGGQQFDEQVSAVFELDALLTLASILSEMSRSDAQLSERLWVEFK